jgi:hypothetical protein
MPPIKVLRTVSLEPSPDPDPTAPHWITLWINDVEIKTIDGVDDVTAMANLLTWMETNHYSESDRDAARSYLNVLLGEGNPPPTEDD